MKALILGGGFAGCTVAHLLKRAGWEVTLIEKEVHLGGGCRTFFYGGHPFTYGPRVYYGYNKAAFDWLNSFVPIRLFPFELKTYVESDERFYTYPIHEDDIPHMRESALITEQLRGRDNSTPPADFEEYWIQRVGRKLYDMFVNNYSKKMWMIPDNKIFDIFKWSAKDKPIESGTRNAYKGSYIGYPVDYSGYNKYFDAMTEGVDVRYGVNATAISGEEPDAIISTIPIDEFMRYQHGELPYVGRDFNVFILPVKQAFPGDVRFCHYAGSEPHTRITEFKKITYYDSPDSLFVLETPSKNNKLYPYLTKANMALVKKYQDSLPPNVYSIGRLGKYIYSTIEQTICQSFECFEQITGTKAPEAEGMRFMGIGDTSMMPKDRAEK